ncbi:hypothetical protein F5887DRAFT_1277615 [Amanita rubescens]|nr:hypothetical protein F5887DRAFT_1277615 [Amanita rubescens]
MSSEIPTEILHDIFHLLCDGPIALHDLNNESHFREFPWAVGQVCRHWRGAFLSHTHLWTSFALKPGTFRTAHFVEMNRRATLYLERSGQQPLTIDVSMPCSGTQTFPKKVWGMLLSCLKRWKKADLKLGGGAKLVLDGLLNSRGYMSSLESLRMSIPHSLAPEHYNAFQIAPHLTELDLSHPRYAATWQFPWAQLTKLKLETSWEEFNKDDNPWGVLFQLENIEELHIIITTFARTLRHRSPLPIVRLPGLRLLEISLVSAMMFSWFTAPLLEHLHIHGCGTNLSYDLLHDSQPYEREITSLIQRSSCRIRRLVLDGCRTKEMRIIMKALASIEELSITHPRRTLDVIEDITGLEGFIYVPKMQVLQVRTRIICGNLVEKTVTVASRLLETRGKGLSLPSHNIMPLKTFVIWLTVQEKFPDEVLEVMRSWPSFAQVYINGSVLERLTPPL